MTSKCWRGRAPLLLAALLGPLSLSSVRAAESYMDLPLETLLDLAVSSASRQEQVWRETAAAVHVLTGEEIRRSGAQSIPEALQLVPGLQVNRIDAQHWAISARGFQSLYSTKMLVLLDGRSVYSLKFSGVHWEELDTYLPDIERIEVIRGPGAALWGANAVNGVINIITQHAAHTTGTQLIAGAGSEERTFASLRSGAALGEQGHWRIYAQTRERDAMAPVDGEPPRGQRLTQAGFRGDWQLTARDALRVSGGLIDETDGQAGGKAEHANQFVDARWQRQLGAGELALQASAESGRRGGADTLDERYHLFALDAQHSLPWGGGHALIYGLGGTLYHDHTDPDQPATLTPASETVKNAHAFLQGEFAFAGGRGRFTAGARLDHLYAVGLEVQPNLRLGYALRPDLYTWAALARATRTPSRVDTGLTVACPPGGIPRVCGPNEPQRLGQDDIDAERVETAEWGLRWWRGSRWSADLALFISRHEDLIVGERGGSAFGHFDNTLAMRSQGGELSLAWRPLPALDLRAYYGYLDFEDDPDAGSTNTTTGPDIKGRAPRHSAGLRWNWRPLPRWTVDGDLRYVDELDFDEVPAYTDLNLRVGWQLRPNLQLALAGRNLLHDQHREYGPDAASRNQPRTEIERGAYLELHWQW